LNDAIALAYQKAAPLDGAVIEELYDPDEETILYSVPSGIATADPVGGGEDIGPVNPEVEVQVIATPPALLLSSPAHPIRIAFGEFVILPELGLLKYEPWLVEYVSIGLLDPSPEIS